MVRRHRHTVPALIAVFLLSLVTIIPASANNTAQALPYSQTWSNTGQITVADDWSGVPGVIGFLGQDITTSTGTDPQTLLGDSRVAGDVDVIPNQTNTGDHERRRREFEIADPVVALQGSGTADAPYLLFHLDTTGRGQHHRLIQPARHRCDGRQRGPTSRSPVPRRIQRQLHKCAGGISSRTPRLGRNAATAGDAGERGPARRGEQSAAGPGPRDDHERRRQRRVGGRRRHHHHRRPDRGSHADSHTGGFANPDAGTHSHAHADSHSFADAFADTDSGRDQDQPGLRRRREQRRDPDQRLHRAPQPDGRSRVALRLVGPVRPADQYHLGRRRPCPGRSRPAGITSSRKLRAPVARCPCRTRTPLGTSR